MSALAHAWWHWFGSLSVQFTALALLVLALELTLLRRAWPELRAGVWLVVVARLVLPPTLTSPVSVARAPTLAPLVASLEALSLPPSWVSFAAAAWLAGMLAAGVLAIRRWRQVRRLWLGAASAPAPQWLQDLAAAVARQLGLRRAPRLRVSLACNSPAVVGFWRPVVVLPHAIEDRTQAEHVLLHELAHVRRRDPLWSLLCLILQLVYWFHPLVWLARSRLQFLREICCDRTVAQVLGPRARDYRSTLLRMARPLLGEARPGLGFIHHHSQILARLLWLERPLAQGRRLRRTLTAGLCGALALCCIPLAVPAPESPRFEDLQGCLQKRYFVLRQLAERGQAAARH
jgi:beta-lactamase regulating signal transducer with metallopeptidase domain